MYNEAQKKKFIGAYTQSVRTANLAKRVFDAFEPYEANWQADLSSQSAEELQQPVVTVMSRFCHNEWTSLAILQEYCKWCIAQEVAGSGNGLLHVRTEDQNKTKKQMVSGPAHLQRYLDEVFDAEGEETIDNIYRCYLWLAFSGLSEEEALAVKISDVHLSEMSVACADMDAPIYREALLAFRNAISLKSFLHKHPNYTKHIRLDRAPGDAVLRGVKENMQLMTIRPIISRILTKAVREGRTDLKLSYLSIWQSGLFYRVREHEMAGIPVDFSEIAIRELGDRLNKDPVQNSAAYRRLVYSKERTYKENYRRWKNTFLV